MKTVLISIKEKFWRLILSGEKSLEIRKARPKDIEYPFRVICYISGRGIMAPLFVMELSKQIIIRNLRKAVAFPSGNYLNTQTEYPADRIIVFTAGTSRKERRLNLILY